MRKSLQVLALASAIAGGLAIAPLHAQEASPQATSPKANDTTGGSNMMGGNNMMGSNGMMGGNGTTGGNDMTGMMNMMTQMTEMMETCNKMMQSSIDKDRGTGDKPAMPEKKG